MCSACITISPPASNSAVEASRRSLMFAEWAARTSTAPISSHSARKPPASTCRVTGSRRARRRCAGRSRQSLQRDGARRVDRRAPAGRHHDGRLRELADAGPSKRVARRAARRAGLRSPAPRPSNLAARARLGDVAAGGGLGRPRPADASAIAATRTFTSSSCAVGVGVAVALLVGSLEALAQQRGRRVERPAARSARRPGRGSAGRRTPRAAPRAAPPGRARPARPSPSRRRPRQPRSASSTLRARSRRALGDDEARAADRTPAAARAEHATDLELLGEPGGVHRARRRRTRPARSRGGRRRARRSRRAAPAASPGRRRARCPGAVSRASRPSRRPSSPTARSAASRVEPHVRRRAPRPAPR